MKDIFKKSFLEGFASQDINIQTIVICLAIALILGLYIFFTYRLIIKKSFYDKNFNISLALVTVITAAIVLTIQSNIAVSLGMVGALSIVRFRTAVKDSMDLAFMFWAISCGIITGAGLAEISIILSVIVTLLILLFQKLPLASTTNVLMAECRDLESWDRVEKKLKEHGGKYSVSSRDVSADRVTVVCEVCTVNLDTLTKELSGIDGLKEFNILSHKGENSL